MGKRQGVERIAARAKSEPAAFGADL